MGPMKGAWNSRAKCEQQGLEIKWGTHWCPAVDMECTEDVGRWRRLVSPTRIS